MQIMIKDDRTRTIIRKIAFLLFSIGTALVISQSLDFFHLKKISVASLIGGIMLLSISLLLHTISKKVN